MKSEWRVSSNPIGQGEFLYQVYRIRDVEKIDHSGNRENFNSYISRDIAEMKAEELNRREKHDE